MRRPTVHVVGAGFSGLSAAIHLGAAANADIVIHERGHRAGGRRRSFVDAATGMTVDAGAYLLSGGWRSTLALLDSIGARDKWRGAEIGELGFIDMASGERWSPRPNSGRWPWWLLSPKRRAPRTSVFDYLRLGRLRRAAAKAVATEFVPPQGPGAERVWRPFCLATMNIAPERASARIAANVLEEAFAAGADGGGLLFPLQDFARAFVEPAERCLLKRGVPIRFGRDLRAMEFVGECAATLEFETDSIELGPGDAVILAVPAWVVSSLAAGVTAPDEFTATVTAHFVASAPPDFPRVLGVVNGPFPWLFRDADRITAVARDASALLEVPREALAAEFWRAIASLTGLAEDLPAWRVIRQKRAGFAATPEQDALRPTCQTPWRNVFLAGGYTRTGLPETIEGAVRSGEVAARWAAASV